VFGYLVISCSIETKNYSQHTIRAYERPLREYAMYKAHLMNTEDAAVETTPLEITDFFTTIRRRNGGLKATTLRQYETALSSFYRHLIGQNVVNTNPMDRVERPKLKDRELKYLHHREVRELLKAIPNMRDKLIIRLIYTTGMRVSEVVGLEVGDIDFDNQAIQVRGKGGKIRTVFCDVDTLTLIREYLHGRTGGRVWGITAMRIRQIFNRYAPRGITPHKIRHSYATELYRRSHNLRLVQELLGHSSIQTTQIYVHADADERRKEYLEAFPRL